jgi:hypothetical protein
MEEKCRISQVPDHLASQLGAVGVVISQEPERRIESSALFASAQQRNVKFREPGTQTLHRFSQGIALREAFEQGRDVLAIRALGRVSPQVLQSRGDPHAGGSELSQLVIKLGAPAELSGC